MAQWNPKKPLTGCHHLDSSTTTTCTNADQYYKIGGTWVDGVCDAGFTLDGSGKLTYNGPSGTKFHLVGVSDLAADKISTVTYGLYVNGVLVSGAETPTDFTTGNAIRNISITSFMRLNTGDYIEIYVKSDVAATDVTSNTLMLTFGEF